ncbi:MAG: 4Fe-4S binding protein, partial [Kiritimatiellae bacterium]|nr:4Fe-4S binding protein [Kiritimatiellia bacterium]
LIFNELCHSCGVCSYVCPENALTEKECTIGTVHAAPDNKPFFFAHGLLNIGEALAPKVVEGVKEYTDPKAINILDASPGTACPVVKTVDGADVAVLVTEPTPFGLNDLKLAVGLSLAMKVPTGIIINRSDGNDAIIADYAKSVDIPVIGRIPFKREYAETYSSGKILVEHHEELRDNLLGIYDRISELKNTEAPPVPEPDIINVDKKTAIPFPVGTAEDHREITVISGKGGTGKTTITGSFAILAENKVLADNDVDAADLHLLLAPSVREAHDFVGGNKAIINADICIACGKCMRACHFDAIRFDGPANDTIDKTYKIDEFACEGCGFCHLVCPIKAIASEPNVTGEWYVSETNYGPMTHARLGIAEENSGKLVSQVRNRAAELARELKMGMILGDGPPGTGCPVIASVSGTDLVIIVTEPTVSGVHDMERVFKLTQHFDVPALVIINKADLNAEQTARIEDIAKKHDSRVIAMIPFDRTVNDALMEGKTVIEYGKCDAEEAIRQAWGEIKTALS